MTNSSSTKASVSAVPRKAGVGQAIVLMFTTMLPVFAMVPLAPDVPLLFQHFHNTPHFDLLVPLIMTAPALLIALLSPFAGMLVDLVGRRRILLVSYILFAIFGLAPLFLDNLTSIIVSRVLLGLPGAVVMTAGNTLIGDYYDGPERRKWMAFQSGVGAVLATGMWLIGGFVAELGWRWPFAIFGIAIPLFAAAWLLLFEPPLATGEHGEKTSLSSARFPYSFMVTACIVTLVATTIYYLYTLYAGVAFDALGVKSPSMIGLVTGIAGVGVPIGAYFYSRISGRSPGQLMGIMYVLFGIGLIGIGLSPNYEVGMLAAFFQQLASGMIIPILIVWVQSGLPANHRGRGMGIWGTCFFLGQFTCPFFTTMLTSKTSGILQTFMIVGVICFAAAIASLVLDRRFSPPQSIV